LNFKLRFNKIYPDFLKILLRKHPSLSQTEITICMYLKLNYTSTDISQQLNISKTSVDTYRYNIRKKINLEKKDSLISYFNSI
jgi:AraC family chitin signaling transcriptional activator